MVVSIGSITTSSTPRTSARDLRCQHHKPLPDLRGRELQGCDSIGESASGSGIVVEPFGVHQVLDGDPPTDAAADVDRIGGQPRASGKVHRIAIHTTDRHVGQGQCGGRADAFGDRRDVLDHLPGDQRVTRFHCVEQPDFDGIEPAGGSQLVHLTFVGEACLHDTEAAHRPARQVVGAHGVSVDGGVEAFVRPLGVCDAVDQHRRGGRCVCATVEHHPRFDPLDDTLRRGVMTHPNRGRMPVHVSEEALLTAVGHTDRAASAQRQQTGVDLQADVFASTERAAHSPERQADLLRVEIEAGGDLGSILVQPLRRDEQIDACPTRIRQRQRGLQAQERLILHSDLVRALHDHLADQSLVAPDDALMADDVAGRVDGWMGAVDGPLGIGEGRQDLVLDDDRLQRPSTRFRVVCSDRRDRLADVADDVAGEDRLIAADQPVGRFAGHIVRRDDRRDTVDEPRRCDVDPHDPRGRMRRAQCCAPQEAVCRHVTRERERALHFGDPIRTRRTVTEPTTQATADDTLPSGRAHCWSSLAAALAVATCCTASMIRP